MMWGVRSENSTCLWKVSGPAYWKHQFRLSLDLSIVCKLQSVLKQPNWPCAFQVYELNIKKKKLSNKSFPSYIDISHNDKKLQKAFSESFFRLNTIIHCQSCSSPEASDSISFPSQKISPHCGHDSTSHTRKGFQWAKTSLSENIKIMRNSNKHSEGKSQYSEDVQEWKSRRCINTKVIY